MTMTSLAPTSRCAIRPSGETFDRVSPGISSVVGRLRDEGVDKPELCCSAGLDGELVLVLWSATLFLNYSHLGTVGCGGGRCVRQCMTDPVTRCSTQSNP